MPDPAVAGMPKRKALAAGALEKRILRRNKMTTTVAPEP